MANVAFIRAANLLAWSAAAWGLDVQKVLDGGKLARVYISF
nr:MAG TPA: hypothetical protein [Caudoviricetes sp.]